MVEDRNKVLENFSFEESMRELEAIVAELESGNVALDKAIDLYQRGTLLKQHCTEKLNQAKLKVESIIHNDGEANALASFDM